MSTSSSSPAVDSAAAPRASRRLKQPAIESVTAPKDPAHACSAVVTSPATVS
ncbi:hypothetical protein ABZ590_22495 [Streptomyces hirsutus]|uniref:hypothetical protein n=1 Tax=Streptomyces hirsutus TaxID=35620 RepID=UPI0033E693D5